MFFFKNLLSEPEYKERRLKALGFASYEDYLSSEIWKQTRNRFYSSEYCNRKGGVPACSVCSSKRSPNVHHTTYKRLGCEEMSDLLLLCKNCHELTHDLLKMKFGSKYKLCNAHKLTKKVRKSNRLKVKYFDAKFL